MANYPYDFGYCVEQDVLALIKQGYKPDVPGNIGTANLQKFILGAAVNIDFVLARAGYGLPIAPTPGNTVGVQVFEKLREINAYYAAAKVELARHAEDAGAQDSQGERLLSYADDQLSRIETGADNFFIQPFNVAGPFDPQADPAGAMDSFTDDPDPITGNNPAPIFHIVPMESTGYAQNGVNPINPLTTW